MVWWMSSIVNEAPVRNYGRLYAYAEYLKILNGGTEPMR
jgi:hypothetical protein